MKHATTRTLYEYWNRLRGSRVCPDRSEIEPSDISSILGDTFILEVVGRQHHAIRLAGTRMCGAYCRELKGKNILTLWAEEDREAIETLLTAVNEDGAAAVVGFEGFTDRDQSVLFETVFLPLGTSSGMRGRMIGATVPMDLPYWLGVWPIIQQKIVSLRMIWPDETPSFLRRSDEIGEPDPIRDTVDRQESRRSYGHLVVLDGGQA